MAGKLTKEGYVKASPEEIRQELVEKIKLKIPDFELQPADLQSNLINTAIEDILQYEDLTETMLNSIGPSFQNDYLFKLFAESIGLSRNKKFNSSVVLTFTGPVATFIPKGTICSSEDGSIIVETQEDILLSTTGSKTVLAETEDILIIKPNLINTITSLNIPGLSVINEAEGIQGVREETYEELKIRAQARFRSPRKGGVDYTHSVLTTNLKVDPRLIAFKIIEDYPYKDSSGNTSYMRAINCIVGGGADEDVALALFKGFIETQKLVAIPSDGDKSRIVKTSIQYYGNTIPLEFLRPKSLKLEIKVIINFGEIVSTPTSIKGATEDTITDYINNKRLGEPVSKLSLTSLILPLLQAKNISSTNITHLDYSFKIDENPATIIGDEGFIQEITYDTYLILSSYSVLIGNVDE